MNAVDFFANLGDHERVRVLYVLRASLGSVGLGLAEALESDQLAKIVDVGTSVERERAEGEEK